MIEQNLSWDSFLETNELEKSIELTGAITNRLLTYGIGTQKEYSLELKILEKLFSGIPQHKGFESMKMFIPKVPIEILNRYNAIKTEVKRINPKLLLTSACGLSPLGLVIATEHPEIEVKDSDLSDVTKYRKSLNLTTPNNYSLDSLNLLDQNSISEYLQRNKRQTSKLVFIVEGLTFYLGDEQRVLLNKNLQYIARSFLKDRGKVYFIFDYFISDVLARERDKVTPLDHPDLKSFKDLFSNVHNGQKAFFKSRDQVKLYLTSQNFSNIRISPVSHENNAHTVFVCEPKEDKK